MFALEVLDPGGAQLVALLLEGELGHERAHPERQREALIDGVQDELARAVSLVAVGVHRNRVDADLLVAAGGPAVEVAFHEPEELVVEDDLAQRAEEPAAHLEVDLERGRHHDLEQLLVLEGDARVGLPGVEPAVEAVAGLVVLLAEVVAVLEHLEVPAHVRRAPRVVASDVGDVLPVALVRVDGDERVVRGAAAERAGARVEHALVGELGVERGLRRVVPMVDEEIPPHVLVLGRLRVERGDLVDLAVAVIFTGLEQEHLVPGAREVRGERTATGPRPDHDVLERRLVRFLLGRGRVVAAARDRRARDHRRLQEVSSSEISHVSPRVIFGTTRRTTCFFYLFRGNFAAWAALTRPPLARISRVFSR